MPEILALPKLGWLSRSNRLLGDIRWCPGLFRQVVVMETIVVRPMMG